MPALTILTNNKFDSPTHLLYNLCVGGARYGESNETEAISCNKRG